MAAQTVRWPTQRRKATLVAAALQQGFIESLEQPVLDLLPGRHVPYLDARKEAVTVEDLLPMRSGLECVAAPTEVTRAEMFAGPDWMQFFLDRAVATCPGQTWVFWAEYRSSVSSFQRAHDLSTSV